jgi:DNA-binding GntR family transcriptional regulator
VLIGILRNETYHGTFVSDFTTEEILQAYQVRASIEATGIKLAVQHVTAEDIEHLKKIYDEMTAEETQKQPGKVLELDNLLHSEIMRLSQNPVLYTLWKTLRYDIWSKFTYSKMNNAPFLAVRHKEMIEAIINRDEETAAEAMKHHILDLKAYL